MKKLNCKEKGITLIALVVTVIILLILAGVTLTNVLNKNGMIKKAMDSKDEYKISEYKDKIEMSHGSVLVEKEGNSTLDLLIEQIYSDNIVPKNSIEKVDEEKALVYTPEGYVFSITEKETKYIGKGIVEKVVDASNDNIKISEINWNSEKHLASVTIEKGEEVSRGLKIQYQVKKEGEEIQEKEWEIGEKVENLELNDIVYARLWNGIEGGKYINKKVEDKNAPTVTAKAEVNERNVKITIEGIDLESGISSYEIYIDEEKYQTIENAKEKEEIEFESMYGNKGFYVIAKDKAENNAQSESKEYKVAGELKLYDNGWLNEEITGGFEKTGLASLKYEGRKNISIVCNKTNVGNSVGTSIYSKNLINNYKGLSKVKIKYSFSSQNLEWGINRCSVGIINSDKNKWISINQLWYYSDQTGGAGSVKSASNVERTLPIESTEPFCFGITLALANHTTVTLTVSYISLIYE